MLSRRTFTLSAAGALAFGEAHAQTPVDEPFEPNHAGYASALDLMARERWRELVEQVNALPASSAYVLLRDLGDGSPLADNLRGLQRVRGGRGVAGAILAGWAWRYRGSAEEIANEEAFARVLLNAAESLIQAVADDPNDGISATYLFHCLKGAGEREMLTALLPTYLAAERKPIQGLSSYTDAISGKWLGSDAEALEFARGHAASAPPASYSVIPTAHVTVAVSRLMFGTEHEQRAALTNFADSAVTAEIIEAHDQFRAEPADSDPFAMYFAHGEFSYAFAQMRDLERMREHLSQQGGFVSWSWEYSPSPHEALRRVRASLGLSAT